MPIQVTLNGRKIELPRSVSLTSYLEEKGLSGRRIAVAYNGNVIAREDYGEVLIDDDDTIEIVRPVGGG
jgi:sulfur carrier protein